jgi:hypothetical protein
MILFNCRIIDIGYLFSFLEDIKKDGKKFAATNFQIEIIIMIIK